MKKRIVIKIGTSTILDESGESHRREWLESLAEDIAKLKADGIETIVVSSGAVGLGRKALGISGRKLKLEEKQAAAAVGQIPIAVAYMVAFSRYNLKVAQVLLTPDDTENRRRHLNARNTLETLLENGIIPVINENDTVATEELRFGDNDRLAARVAQMIFADTLIIFSDIDGLYDSNPNTNPSAKHLAVISEITPEIEAMAGGVGSELSSGGMVTKIAAAKISAACGAETIITSGAPLNPISKLLAGGRHTKFMPSTATSSARKAWIAASLNASGKIIIDEGAEKALRNGKSLLSAGVKRVEGSFDRGDTVSILSSGGQEIAVGVIAYNNEDSAKIAGKQSSEISVILGYDGRESLIHRDDMVMR